jgi:hypothetical protein
MSEIQLQLARAHEQAENIHMRNMGILLVTNICGEEVHVKRLNVTAPGSGQHCLESAIPLAVTFERKDLPSIVNKQTSSPKR